MQVARRGLGREPIKRGRMMELKRDYSYPFAAEVVTSCMQPIGRLRDQRSTPSCVGQAVAAAVEGLTGFDGSAISLWTDARRREGSLFDPEAGTNPDAAIDSLIARGLDPYEPGEESRRPGEYVVMPDLDDELEAEDRKWSASIQRFLINGATTAKQRLEIVAALQTKTHGVLWGVGLRDPFFGLNENDVADERHIGATYNGHEMRIFIYDADTDRFGVQNSWSDFAGLTFQGRRYPGCFWVKAEAAIALAWDTMIVQLG